MITKNIFLSLAIFLIILFLSPSKSLYSESPVEWHKYNKGLQLAKKLNRPIVLDFYAEWCKWCKVMDKETFSDPTVAGILKKNYICIRIDTMAGNEVINFKNHKLNPQEFASLMGVSGLPTVIFMDRDENLITRIPGFLKKDLFLPLLDYIKNECYRKNITFEDYMNGKTKCGR